MSDAIAPFDPTERNITEYKQSHSDLRAAGPLVRVDAPAGGSAWIVTEDALARQVLTDPRFVKDPAMAPLDWDRQMAGLERPAAEQASLTTADGPDHAQLRKAHAPLFSARGISRYYDRMLVIARQLLADAAESVPAGTPVDLTLDFTTRYPVAVVCDVLGIPPENVDRTMQACRDMFNPDPAAFGAAFATFAELADAALEAGDGVAAELRDRLPADTSQEDLRYFIFLIIFAGQPTMDSSLGYLLAGLLENGVPGTERKVLEDFVQTALRRQPPAPFTLWRFTATEVEVAGVTLPERTPVLVDLFGITVAPDRPEGPDLVFGAGPHYCIGAQLAMFEMRALAEVFAENHAGARLGVPYAELRQTDIGGTQGSKLTALPVVFRE
ncbi:cytochrome P450 [Streptomyces sp. NPDC005423]|uniref:cytochrome P450 n=1 Tax=Streptomyces sp. NPDC005423 TaxID=3155343 RepID=UPI0033AE55BD